MDEEKALKTPDLSSSLQLQIRQIVKQNPSLSSQHAEELENVLTALAALPFKDEIQQANFFEQVQSLQGYHIIQIFTLGVAPLQQSAEVSSFQFLEEVKKLFDICYSFCYTSDVSKRVPFDYYMTALKFCFPSDTKQCLPTKVVSTLLELVQVFQDGKFAAERDAYFRMFGRINGTTSDFFNKILQIFEKRRHEEYLVEIIDRTVRLASADDKHAIKLVKDVTLQSERAISSFFVINWMKVLESTNVTNGFAFALAEVDLSGRKIEPFFSGVIKFQSYNLPYQSTISYFLRVLEDMKRKGNNVNIPQEKKRLDIFFNHVNHFCVHPNIATLSLQLLATTSISNEVLREVLDGFVHRARTEDNFMETAFINELVIKVLSLRPDGELLNKVMKFWITSFSGDPGYATLSCLLALFEEGSNSERETAEGILHFLERLPRTLLLLMVVWQKFLLWLIKIFPTTFHWRPEVVALIEKAAAVAVQQPVGKHQSQHFIEQAPTFQFFQWVCQQKCTEEIKREMIWLLTCCTHSEAASHTWASATDIEVIVSLSSCQHLTFSSRKSILQELIPLNPLLGETAKTILKQVVTAIASDQSLECTEEILPEVFVLVKNVVDGKGPKTTPEDFFNALLLLVRVPISGDRRLKVIRYFWNNESKIDFERSLYILQPIVMQECLFKEGGNEYFDHLFRAVVETLKGDYVLCEQLLCTQHPFGQFPSTAVLKVWTSAVAGLISLGLYKEEIDLRYCRPVLQEAWGFDSPVEILQLFLLVRSTVRSLVCLSRSQLDASSSRNAEISAQGCSSWETDHLENFVRAAMIILRSDMLTTMEKLLLVKKVCDVILSTPHITTVLTNALKNLFPSNISEAGGDFSNSEKIHSSFNRVLPILGNPKLLNELSRISQIVNTNKLFLAVSKKMSDMSSKVHSVDVLLYIASLKDVDQAFFNHLLPFVEVAIDNSSSLENVLEVLKELVHVLRHVRSELIPLTMLNFAYFIENPVDKQERDRFLLYVAIKWKISPSHHVLLFLEVPRLLWRAYSTASASKRSEVIHRVQEIVNKNKISRHDWVVHENTCQITEIVFNKVFRLPDRGFISKRIACCDLEWLVLHSPLSTEDAALAFDLSCLLFQASGHRLRCLSFSDVRIVNGVFEFYESETASGVSNEDICATSLVKEGSTSPVKKKQEAVLIPVVMAQKVIHYLKPLLGQEEDLHDNVLSVWRLICKPQEEVRCMAGCDFFLDDYENIFESILAEASCMETIFIWTRLNPHHASQCSHVIANSCKWHSNETEDVDKEAAMNVQTLVSTALCNIRGPHMGCFRHCRQSDLESLGTFLESRLPIEVTTRVLEIYQINIQAGVEVGEIVTSWSSIEQSLKLVEKIRSYWEDGVKSPSNPPPSEFVWQLLKSFAHLCKDSCEDLLAKLEKLVELHELLWDDPYGLKRLPTWRQTMITDGFPARAIDSWCVAFLMTPLENLTSGDIDAVVYLDSRSLQLVNLDSTLLKGSTPVSEIIKRVIFPDHGFQETEGDGITKSEFRERIQLARFLGEFINILRSLKPEENPKDAVVREKVVDACSKLCISHENEYENRNDLYKIHRQRLTSLLQEIFTSQSTFSSEEKRESSQDCAVTHQADNLPTVLRHKEVYETMLVLLRRWLSGIVTRPTLASHTQEIVQLLFSVQPSNDDRALLEKLNDTIKGRILSLERNQSLMAQLQAVGFNQRGKDDPDLWSSRKVELPCYLSKRESPNGRMFSKKLAEVLRSHWNEWKDLLSMCNVDYVKVGDVKVCREDLFGVQASLKEMEEQVAAVKEHAKQLSSAPFNTDYFNSAEDLDRQVEQLIHMEHQHRTRIEKLHKRGTSIPKVSKQRYYHISYCSSAFETS